MYSTFICPLKLNYFSISNYLRNVHEPNNCVDVGLDILYWVMSSSQKIIVSLKAKHKIVKFNILFVTIRCEIEGVFVISKHKKVTGNVFVSNKAACVYTVCSGVFSWSHTTTIIVTLLREVLLYLSPKRYNLRCFEWIHPVIHKEGGSYEFSDICFVTTVYVCILL